MQILVDADALVALAKKDDSNHQKALKIAQELKSAVLFASCFTIPEATTVCHTAFPKKPVKHS